MARLFDRQQANEKLNKSSHENLITTQTLNHSSKEN
jgi:hypothetical protein